jgi:hypothetical protein
VDDFSFISRDPFICNLQSALEAYFLERDPKRVTAAPPPDDTRRGPGDVPAVADRSLVDWVPMRQPNGRRIFNKFSILDARWVSCKLAERWKHKYGMHAFVPPQPESIPIADTARVFILGDWATGLPRARRVARIIGDLLEKGKAAGLQQHVVHLGDTYYSGWPTEYRDRLLQYWPVKEGDAERIGSWSLNGNHDMFSGGDGYYAVLLNDRRFLKQQSSVFSLHNKSWQILALDTAYEDNDLKDQTGWLRTKFDESGRKIMLLSHHQLFSAYETAGQKISAKMSGFLAENRVRGWFWGHEHRCVIYEDYMQVPAARCIGHGGVPVYMWHRNNSKYKSPVDYEYRDRLPLSLEPWAYMGFVILDFHGDIINVEYVNENGVTHYCERIF